MKIHIYSELDFNCQILHAIFRRNWKNAKVSETIPKMDEIGMVSGDRINDKTLKEKYVDGEEEILKKYQIFGILALIIGVVSIYSGIGYFQEGDINNGVLVTTIGGILLCIVLFGVFVTIMNKVNSNK